MNQCLTVGLGQILVKLLPVLIMDDVVHTGVNQLLLLVLQVLCHIIGHEYNAALSVHHKQKPIQGLKTSR